MKRILDTVFWLSVIATVMLSWAACETVSDSALTGAFCAGFLGLITGMLSLQQEEP